MPNRAYTEHEKRREESDREYKGNKENRERERKGERERGNKENKEREENEAEKS